MSTAAIRLITAGFLLFLFLPLFGRALGVEPEPIENRSLAERPEITLAGLFDTEFYRRMTSYLIDTLPWRKHAVSGAAWVNLKVFNDSPSPRVHIGRDGWLYYDNAFRRPCMFDIAVPSVIETIEQWTALLEASGREFRFTITPDKHSIYPEFMSSRVRRLAECSENKRAELRSSLTRSSPPGYIDLFGLLERAKYERRGLLFFSNDSHLSSLGSAIQTAGIVETVQPGLWDPEAVTLVDHRPHVGDLTRMMGFPSGVPIDWYQVMRADVKLVAEEQIDLPEGPPLQHFRSSSQSSPLVNKRVLIIQDSQLILTIPMLQQYFEDLTLLNWNSLNPDVAMPLIEDSDLVIVQINERGSYVRIAQQLGSQDFLDRLERLPKRSEAEVVFAADQNPVQVCDDTGLAQVELTWSTDRAIPIEVRVGAPAGALFAAGAGIGSAQTGKWVTDGMTFFLQNASDNAESLEATVATLTMRVETTGCPEA